MMPPLLGEHTEEILKEIGYADEKIRALKADDIIRQYVTP
jgi:crotonobetainyl-CoA:carnitine CoA-transferase CaiB-like acyl-CoA transferase